MFFPMTQFDAAPDSVLRVKIFPHQKDYPPHGEDKDTRHVDLAAVDGRCEMWAADADRAQAQTRSLGRFTTLRLTAKDKRLPLWIRCDGAGGLTVKRPGRVTAYTYPGEFYVHRSDAGRGGKGLEIVNFVGLESYLRGVVPSEVMPSWPIETLRSQAVAARTYAIFHLAMAARVNGNPYHDFDDTVRFQAYTGLTGTHPRTDDAIASTRGEILVFKNNVIQAYYHADSGGQTEAPENVWHIHVPFVASRSEAFIKDITHGTWRIEAKLADMERRLRAQGLIPAGESIAAVRVPASGLTRAKRVKRVAVTLRSGGTVSVTLAAFKHALGVTLPSALFTVDMAVKAPVPAKPLKVVVTGKGSGHGVGMSQVGASFLGKMPGWDYRRILQFYYQGVRLCAIGAIDPAAASEGGPLPCYNVADGTASERSLYNAFNPSS